MLLGAQSAERLSGGLCGRPLAPGVYLVTATAEGYQPRSAQIQIPEDGSGRIHNFVLERLAKQEKVWPPYHLVPWTAPAARNCTLNCVPLRCNSFGQRPLLQQKLLCSAAVQAEANTIATTATGLAAFWERETKT